MDYFWPCVGFTWLCYLWEAYLGKRQRSLFRNVRTVPEELQGRLDQETFEKSRLYQIDRSTFGFYHGIYSQVEITVFLLYGVFPWMWQWSGDLLDSFGYGAEYEITQSIVFLLVTMFVGDITGLPWLVYDTFVIEQRHGFNKQTVRFFIWDQLKGVALQVLLMPPIVAGLLACIQWGGEYFYVYTWLFAFLITMVMVTIYPNYIAPLFDTYTPLPHGPLRTAIVQLAAELEFPLKKLFVVDGSQRSNHSNAYFYGFCNNKRIVLFDTLLDEKLLSEIKQDGGVKEEVENEHKEGDEQPKEEDTKKNKKGGCNTEEVLAVLAHELGHWKLSHTVKNLIISEVNLFFLFFMFGFFLVDDTVFTSFGFYEGRPTIIGLYLVVSLIFSPYHQVVTFLMIQLTRRYEYQADRFAAELGRGSDLRMALAKLNKDNLSFPIADQLYSAFHHSHPTFLERVRALAAITKTTKMD